MFQDFEDPKDSKNTGQHVKLLRRAMAKGGLDAFIVPREDAFQGEYVPAANERLKWLTGFGGSAGVAVVMARQAAIFVDGRYILQAPDQVDTGIFEVVPIAETGPLAWLEQKLRKNQRIGIDPKLHTLAFAGAVEKLARRMSLDIDYVSDNPVDRVWADRPAMPETQIIVHPNRLAGRTSLDKRCALGHQLADANQAAMLVTQPENIAWLLNIRADDVPHTPFALSFGILKASGRFDWFIDPRRVDAETRQHVGDKLHIHASDKLTASLGKLKIKIRLDPSTTPIWFAAQLGGAEIVHGEDLCTLAKACKTKAEIKGTKAAHLRDGAALCRFLCWLDARGRSGKISEIDAARQAEAFRAETGKLRDLSFDTISGSGPNGAIVHYRVTHATNRHLRPGDIYLIDSGGQYADGTTDVTRTVLIEGRPPPIGAVDAFTRVLRGHIALAAVRFPTGTNGMQLDTLARAPLWAAGQDFDHGTGHGVGSYLSVHEGPQRISKGGMVPMAPGMIVSNEPGYYAAGRFGIRIENLQYVRPAKNTGDRHRDMLEFGALTLAPIDRRLIDQSALTGDEKTWLNTYHAEVLAKVKPLVDSGTAKWLERACRPMR